MLKIRVNIKTNPQFFKMTNIFEHFSVLSLREVRI